MASSRVPGKPHHRARGFQNNYVEFERKSLSELLRWRRDALRDHLPPPPLAPTPRVSPDLAWLRSNAGAGAETVPAINWIGHATVLAQMGGLTVLTDPMFSQRASPLAFAGPKRQTPPGIALAGLPHVDLVLVSHNHYDHLDLPSVAALNRQAGGPPLFVVPRGLKAWMAGHDIRDAVELDWWDRHPVPGPQGVVEVALVPARSTGRREVRPTQWRRSGAALSFSRQIAICCSPATRAIHATSPTFAGTSPIGRRPSKAAASTSR